MRDRPKLLLIDVGADSLLRHAAEAQGFEVAAAAGVAAGVDACRAFGPDVALLDAGPDGGAAAPAVRALRAARPRCPVVLLLGADFPEAGPEAVRQGAFDFLVKPAEPERLGALLAPAVEAARLMRAPSLLPLGGEEDCLLAGSTRMQEVCRAVARLARQDLPVLIRGERGAGKKLLARALHQHSARADGPLLAVDCAALPQPLLESELFGHEPGAFPAAAARRIGKLERCAGGTLLLKEVGDLPLAPQDQILRFLREGWFERLGGCETVRADVRLLATTSQDLERLVARGWFRGELYARLSGAVVRVPPLRERAEDIPGLAHAFLFRETGRALRGFSPEALACLLAYPWPGNVRELQHAVREAALQAHGPVIVPAHLPQPLRGTAPPPPPPAEDGETLRDLIRSLCRPAECDLRARVLRAVEQTLLAGVLRQTGGNQLRASAVLGIDRKTLRRKLRTCALRPDFRKKRYSRLTPPVCS